MEKDIYPRLQEQLDHYSLGFPATESGVEIDILKEMFTEEEGAIATALTTDLETHETIAQRLGRPVDEVSAPLEDKEISDQGGTILLVEQKRTDGHGACKAGVCSRNWAHHFQPSYQQVVGIPFGFHLLNALIS